MVSPPGRRVETDAERTILEDVLRWAIPIGLALATLTLVASVVTGLFQAYWARGVTSVLVLAFTSLAWVMKRQGHLRRAAGWLIAGVGLTIAVALTFSGGLRSPTAMLLLYLITLCGWVYGRRAASVMALLALGVVVLYFGLGKAGVLPEPPPLPPFGMLVMLGAMIALIWSASAQPAQRMREALGQAEARQRELAAEQARRLEAARQFQAVFDQASNLMGLVSPDGVLRSVNRAALHFAGLQRADQVVGRPFAEGPWWEPSQRPWLQEQLDRAVTGAGTVRFETTHLDGHGRRRTMDASLAPFRDEAGTLRYLIVEGRDITDQVARRERDDTTRRLELVGQLAGGVAHDFNNVMMVILSSAEVMRADLATAGTPAPAVAQGLEAILEAGQRASDLTRRLLSFARRSPVARRTMELHPLLESTAGLLERTLPSSVRVVCELSATEDRLEGDPAALESVVLNLALNARDAMPEGGTLTLSTARVELDAERCRELGFGLTPGSYLRLSVRDTGTGIAPEHLGRLFEPFFTTKEDGKGTGLGLASVYGAVREHRGAVTVESEPGKGSVFHLLLPLSAARVSGKKLPGVRPGFPGVKALVVDDEAALRATVPRLLRRLGIESVTAASAEEGAEAFHDGIDLLVSDVVLPGRRGDQLAVELLARKPGLKVLLVSGYPRDLDPAALPPDRVRLLGKPFTLDELGRSLEALLGPSAEA